MSAISRRRWIAGIGAGLVAASAWRDGRAAVASREWPVAGFDALVWNAVGELVIEQTARERLSVSAPSEALDKVVAEVRGRTLHIGFKPGPLQIREPIVFRLDARTLQAIELDGAGEARITALSAGALVLRLKGSVTTWIGTLRAERLDARLEGSGTLRIESGEVRQQRIVVAGASDYAAPALASREADVLIEGSGALQLAASERLQARIDGSGDVSYRGTPRVTQQINGAGRVHRDGDGD
jgi:hypothetical protein